MISNNSYPQNDYRYYLQHSAKGTTWGKHKYIAIKNGRYIYPEDLVNGVKNGVDNLLGGKQKRDMQTRLKITDQANREADRLRDQSNRINSKSGYFNKDGKDPYKEAWDKSQSARNIANATAREYHKSRAAYDKTVYGRIDKVKDATGKAKKRAKKAAGRLRSRFSDALKRYI